MFIAPAVPKETQLMEFLICLGAIDIRPLLGQAQTFRTSGGKAAPIISLSTLL